MIPPSLIVCGPQGGWPSHEELARLKAFLLSEPRLEPFLATIRELPQLWPLLKRTAPGIQASEAIELLGSLTQWINNEDCFPRDSTPPNIISTPLTVIIQIVQYFQYLKGNGTTHANVISSVQSGGFQGFCTGILAATALACSKDELEINTFGAVALRLAVCVGAAVDSDGKFGELAFVTKSLAVRWKAEGGKKELERILKKYPDVGALALLCESQETNFSSGIFISSQRTKQCICSQQCNHYIVTEPRSRLRTHVCDTSQCRRTFSLQRFG